MNILMLKYGDFLKAIVEKEKKQGTGCAGRCRTDLCSACYIKINLHTPTVFVSRAGFFFSFANVNGNVLAQFTRDIYSC